MMVQLLYVLLAVPVAAAPADSIFLSDQPHRILYTHQGWGELGIDTCAREKNQKVLPLQIGEKIYDKGLGHHAPGELFVDLGGEFATFESDVGLQNLPGCNGSVIFKVFVDDREKFDSGVMKSGMPARHVSISVEGAMELRLLVVEAGDGLTCDCADWADARLIRSTSPRSPVPGSLLDAAPFAEVITCDPARIDGAKATRVQEYRAEDIFLETPLAADTEGRYTPASYDASGRCIGLRWLENRQIRELAIEFAGAGPSKSGMQLQCWVGGSLWQGKWQPLAGSLSETGHGWRYVVDWSKIPDAHGSTRKIRWILPPGEKVTVRRLVALTPTRMETLDLRITVDKPVREQGHVEIYNGQIVQCERSIRQTQWELSQPLAIQVRYAKPRPWKTDRTVLRFQLPGASFGVAVDEVVKNGGVYVRDAGLFVSRGDMNRDVAGFLGSHQGTKTVLQRVREMPDQTLAQAIEHIHRPKQDLQPMLLSLACDNHKFIVQRDGIIDFTSVGDPIDRIQTHASKNKARMTPKFGSRKDLKISRHLEAGWLPMPVTEVEDADAKYMQRTFVAPYGGMINQWIDRKPVCVVQLTATPSAGKTASIDLQFEADTASHVLPEVKGRDVIFDGRLMATVGSTDISLSEVSKGVVRLTWTNETQGSFVAIMIPSWSAPPPMAQTVYQPPLDAGFQSYWKKLLDTAMQAELPDPLLTNLIRASQVHCLLAARNEEEGKRIAPWIASMSYGPLESESNSIVRGMDFWGHHDFARRSLDFFIDKYSPIGMLTTGYTLMGTGWHLWTLGEHYQLTQDKAWLQGVAPKVARVCDWIANQCAKTQGGTSAGRPFESGLVPPGVMADWNAYAYYFCLNGYYYKGLFEAAQALTGIEYPGASNMLANARAFRDDILHAYHSAQARMPVYPLKDGTSVLGYPSQLTAPGPTNNFFPGEDGNRSWCYDVELGAHQLVPQGVLDPRSRDVADLMDHMEDVQFLADGWFDYSAESNEKDWFNLGGFSKVQPYYCRNLEIDSAPCDDVKPFIRSYFNTIPSLLGLETLSFQEHFNGVGAWNKTHETGYFLYYSRVMLVQERGKELWLMPFVTSRWLEDGKAISVKNAPTFFGPVSYEVHSKVKQNHVDVDVTWPTQSRPKSIAIRVRHPEGHPIKAVRTDAGEKDTAQIRRDENDAEVIHLSADGPTTRVTVEY